MGHFENKNTEERRECREEEKKRTSKGEEIKIKRKKKKEGEDASMNHRKEGIKCE